MQLHIMYMADITVRHYSFAVRVSVKERVGVKIYAGYNIPRVRAWVKPDCGYHA